MKLHRRLVLLLPLLALPARAAQPVRPQGRLLFADDFEGGLDAGRWIAEIAPEPGSRVYTQSGRLVLDTRGGVTVWLKQRLQGNLLIEFRRMVLVEGGPNDRLSDLNLFWMASDARGGPPFGRNGQFEAYDDLDLYYVGMGGNHNSSTRFRKYGRGERRLLQEFSDAAHLLQANREYLIQVLVQDGRTSFHVDGVEFFAFSDPDPLRSGYFGLRSTWSRQAVAALRVWQLP